MKCSRNVSVKFDGLNSLLKDFAGSKAQARSTVETAMRATVAKAQKTARDMAAVDTGYMRDHVQVNSVESSGNTVTGEFESKAPYSSYVEFGTYKQRAQPFVRPAQADATPYFYKQLQQAMKEVSQ